MNLQMPSLARPISWRGFTAGLGPFFRTLRRREILHVSLPTCSSFPIVFVLHALASSRMSVLYHFSGRNDQTAPFSTCLASSQYPQFTMSLPRYKQRQTHRDMFSLQNYL